MKFALPIQRFSYQKKNGLLWLNLFLDSPDWTWPILRRMIFWVFYGGFSLNHNFRFWIWFCLRLWRWDLSSYDNWNVTLVLNLLIYRLNYCTERFHHSFTFPVKFRGSDTSIKLRKKRNSIMDQMNIKLQYHISYMTIIMIIVNFVKEKMRSVIALNDREKSSDWIFIGT